MLIDCIYKIINWHKMMVLYFKYFMRYMKWYLNIFDRMLWLNETLIELKQINHGDKNQSWFQILIRHIIYAYVDTFRTKSLYGRESLSHFFWFSFMHIGVHLYFKQSEPESTRISDANFIIVLTNSFPILQFLFFRVFWAVLYQMI